MKIKKHGSTYVGQDKTEEFTCQNCGCKFTVKENEYYIDYGGANDSNWTISSTVTYTWSSIIKDYYVCSCPECHKIIKKTHERTNYNYCTLTGTCSDSSITNTVSDLTINNAITSDKASIKSTLTI